MPNKLSLVADDDPFVRTLIKSVLHAEGFHTMEAENGVQALELVRRFDGAVDLLVSDIEMPEMDGFTMACSVRTAFPMIPVILVSGQPVIDRAALLNAGFEFVQKPFQPATLLSAVEKVMRGRTPPARGHSAS
jgi:two-component system cell cycle response regulator CpdR